MQMKQHYIYILYLRLRQIVKVLKLQKPKIKKNQKKILSRLVKEDFHLHILFLLIFPFPF